MAPEYAFQTGSYVSLYYLLEAANLVVDDLGVQKFPRVLYDIFLKEIVDRDTELAAYFQVASNFKNEAVALCAREDASVGERLRLVYELRVLNLRIGTNVALIERMVDHAMNLRRLLLLVYP